MHFHDQLAPALRTPVRREITKRIREKGFQTLLSMFAEEHRRDGPRSAYSFMRLIVELTGERAMESEA